MVRAAAPRVSEAIARAQTLPQLFFARVADSPKAEAFRYPTAGGWRSLDWAQTAAQVRAIACGLLALGVKPEQRCAILSSTRMEWVLSDLAILCAGAATTTIYPSNTADECAYILADCGAVVAFAENDAQVAKLRSHRAEMPELRRVITFDGNASDDGWVLPLPGLEEEGRSAGREHPGAYEQATEHTRHDSLATLIYTSGTTGQPKGVELTHDNWIYEAEAVDAIQVFGPDDLHYLWLPLAHSFGKVIEAAALRIGFVNAVDGRVERMAENLTAIRPTMVCAVPRVFEKLAKKVITTAHAHGRVRGRMFDWALAVGRKGSRVERRVADRLVFSKLRARMGGRLRFFISGSAALPHDVAQFFRTAGLDIYEGYGLTESSAASCFAYPGAFRPGSVGRPLPGTEVRIAEGDGEILLRGRGVMRGYHGMPEATAEALDGDGWLHTGDIGRLDADGYLYITDRKKDLIKTSGGKYVAPQMLENRVKGLCPYISQVLAHGNNRNYVTALVTLDAEAVRALPSGDVHAVVAECIKSVNSDLPSYATIKHFTILPDDLTIERGELTANMKIKRKVVEERYREVLDGMYEGTRPF